MNGLFSNYSKNSIHRLIFNEYTGVLIFKSFLYDCIIYKRNWHIQLQMELYFLCCFHSTFFLFHPLNLSAFNWIFLRKIYNWPYPEVQFPKENERTLWANQVSFTFRRILDQGDEWSQRQRMHICKVYRAMEHGH